MKLSLLSITSKPLPIPSSLLKVVSEPITVVKMKVLAGTDTGARPAIMLVSKSSVTEGTTLFLLYLFFALNNKN